MTSDIENDGHGPNGSQRSEFSHVVKLADIPKQGRTLSLTANTATCQALSARLGLPEISAFSLKGIITPLRRHDYCLEATLTAQYSQTCVITLEPVPRPLSEQIAIMFAPLEGGSAGESVDVSLDDDIPIVFLGDQIDVGEAVVQYFAEQLDPYPRVERAVFDEQVGEAALLDKEKLDNPFKVLEKLKPQ